MNLPEQAPILRDTTTGKFLAGTSGNPGGRPKGSRNRVTLMKLMVEEAVREDNAEAMVRVAKLIVEQALNGDDKSQKLVWDAIMSKSSSDDKSTASEKVTIHIGGVEPLPSATIVGEHSTIDLEDSPDHE